MELNDLTVDKKFKLLTYKYIPNRSAQVYSLEDFMPIARTLDKLHNEGYVHSDVRLVNMVFPDDGESKLIDFELAKSVGMPYPTGYSNALPERHAEAEGNMPRKVIHDKYSFIHIVLSKVFLTPRQKEFLEKYQSGREQSCNLVDLLNNVSIIKA